MLNNNSIQLYGTHSLSSAIQQADVMSLSLLFSLGRYYLDIPIERTNPIWNINKPTTLLETPHFLLLEQVGNPVVSANQQPLTALQTALSACHAPGQYSLIFIVTSDGVQNRIYFGVRGHSSNSSYEFVENLGNFLQGNWPGTRLRRCNHQESPLVTSLHNMDYAVALTGVPSLKPGDGQGYPQTLDRLMRGMRGKKFAYVVIAEPVNRTEVDGVIYQCRNLLGLVHSLTKMNLSLAETEGTTEGENTTVGKTESISSMNTDFTTSLLLGANGLADLFPPAGLLAAFASVGLPFLSSKFGWQQTQSDSKNITTGNSFSKNFSLSRTLGKEYINAHAQAVEAQLQRYTNRFEQSANMGCWNVGTYLLAGDLVTAKQGATQLTSLLNGEKSCFEAMRLHDLHPVWTNGVQVALNDLRQPEISLANPQQKEDLQHPLGNLFNGLTTPLNTEELALLVNLPRQEVPGVRVMPTASFSLNPPVTSDAAEINLGDLLDGGELTPLKYKLSLKSLTKHTLVTGINGSGKSTTCLKIIREMLKLNIPFLVIEPAKTEYVEWAISHNQKLPPESPDRIAIYMPGEHSAQKMKELDPLILNPFDIIWLGTEEIPQVLAHIDRLKSIFNASFPMQEVLPVLLEEVLFATYKKPFDWLADPLPDFSTTRPTLTQMLDKIRPVIKGKGYEDKIADNLIAALTTRIQSLRQGWKKKLFDQSQSTPWSNLFDRPAVINISYLGDDADKSFTMALILQFLYEYRQAQRDSPKFPKPSVGSLSHLLIIEEAHRIMLRTGEATMEQANPQAKVAEMFSNILSEIRAYGQGLLVVDQVPSRLIPDAIKNTNLKIVHRLVAADDRQTMGDCMGLNPEQSAIINRLRPGQAIAYGDLDDAAGWIQITT
ncbi:ATP-binding protein [Aerosakkonema funiforme]|uniref:ATP-binding protein n=1 Tax=Aerosakkonema funiforme TaxID=1246630 RepID=UPI0035B9547B